MSDTQELEVYLVLKTISTYLRFGLCLKVIKSRSEVNCIVFTHANLSM